MIRADGTEDYFYWLLAFVDCYDNPVDDYMDLLRLMDENDANRAQDGIALRDRFERESGEELYRTGPCSFLEMMVALAIRMEDDIMFDPDFGDRTAEWFWQMMDDSGLIFLDSGQFSWALAKNALARIGQRDYRKNGQGGLFLVKNGQIDMRKVSLWYQMNYKTSQMLGLKQKFRRNR